MTPKRLAEIRKIHTEQDWWISVQLLDELVDALAAAEQRAAAAEADADRLEAILRKCAPCGPRPDIGRLIDEQQNALGAHAAAVALRPTEATP